MQLRRITDILSNLCTKFNLMWSWDLKVMYTITQLCEDMALKDWTFSSFPITLIMQIFCMVISIHSAQDFICSIFFYPHSSQIAEQLMTLAYENGINLFDTAEVYAAGKWVLSLSSSSFTPLRRRMLTCCNSNRRHDGLCLRQWWTMLVCFY